MDYASLSPGESRSTNGPARRRIWPAGYEFGLHVVGGVIKSHGQR